MGDAPDDALQWGREALTLLSGGEDTPLTADVLRWQGSVLRDRGRTSDAEPLYRESLEIATTLGYDAGRAHAVNALASLALRRGELAEAENLMMESLRLAHWCGDARLVGMLQQNLGIVADVRGNPVAALAHYRVSMQTFEATNDLQPLSWVLNNVGMLHAREGRYAEAGESYTRALGIARARGDLMSEGILEENRAELFLLMDSVEEAYAPMRRAREVAELRRDDLRLGAALKLAGAYERLTGRLLEATDTLRHALTLSAVAEDALLGAEVLYQFGLALDAFGDHQGAANAWHSALDAFDRMGARQWVGRVRQRLTGAGTYRYL